MTTRRRQRVQEALALVSAVERAFAELKPTFVGVTELGGEIGFEVAVRTLPRGQPTRRQFRSFPVELVTAAKPHALV